MKITAQQFISEYENGTVEAADGISYSTKDVTNENYRIYNGKSKSSTDADGLEKIMLNIPWICARTLLYGSDIDTKDLQMRSLNGEGIVALAILRMAVISHLNRTNFGEFIDDVRSDMIFFGSVLIKIVDGVPKTVDLRNSIIPPHDSDIQNTGLIEYQFWTYKECLAHKKDWSEENWKIVEEVFEKNSTTGIYQIKMIEFWKYEEFEGEMHKVCERSLDMSNIDPKTFDDASTWQSSVVLETFKTPHKKRRETAFLRKKYGEYEELFPYIYFPFIKLKGRGLGLGVIEMLVGINTLFNERWYYARKKDILSLMSIMVHKVKDGNRSLEQANLSNLTTGAFIQIGVDEDLNRLPVDGSANELLAISDKLFELARQIIGITAQGAGQDMPSTTTATVAIANKQTQQTTYDYLIERVSFLMKILFQDFFMEQIIEELTAEEIVSITGSTRELEELDKVLAKNAVNRAALDFQTRTGLLPTAEEVAFIEEGIINTLKSAKDRFPQIKKEILKDLDYYVEFYVNNEGFDKAVKIQNLMQILQMNTALSREQIEAVIVDLMGENARQFEKTDEEKQRELEAMQAQAMAENAPVNPVGNQPQDQQFQFANAPIRR
jgi:hypothetical protein